MTETPEQMLHCMQRLSHSQALYGNEQDALKWLLAAYAEAASERDELMLELNNRRIIHAQVVDWLEATQQQRDEALAWGHGLRIVLERIGESVPCGCVPCRNQCQSDQAKAAYFDGVQELAQATLLEKHSPAAQSGRRRRACEQKRHRHGRSACLRLADVAGFHVATAPTEEAPRLGVSATARVHTRAKEGERMTTEQKALLVWIVDQHFRRSQEMYSRGVELLTENPKGMQPLSNRAFDAARRRLEQDRMNALRISQVIDQIEVTD